VFEQIACCADCGGCMVGSGEAREEERDRGVAHELVRDAVPIVDDLGRGAVEARDIRREKSSGPARFAIPSSRGRPRT
jgi:hypothetical protein